MLDYFANRKKPILGAIAGALTYVAAKAGLDLDPELAALIAGVIFTAVVERVGPVFGYDVATTEVVRGRRR